MARARCVTRKNVPCAYVQEMLSVPIDGVMWKELQKNLTLVKPTSNWQTRQIDHNLYWYEQCSIDSKRRVEVTEHDQTTTETSSSTKLGSLRRRIVFPCLYTDSCQLGTKTELEGYGAGICSWWLETLEMQMGLWGNITTFRREKPILSPTVLE